MLVQWLSTKSQILLLPTFYKIRKLINNTLKSNIAKKFTIDNVEEAIEYYKQNMTDGKVIIEGWSEEKWFIECLKSLFAILHIRLGTHSLKIKAYLLWFDMPLLTFWKL